MSILVDQSQANAQLSQFGAQVPAKMAPAAQAVKGTSDAVGEMTERMAVGQQGAVRLGEVTNLAGEKVRESMYEARGEAGLLGEAFGIHLPRHVRSFIAELPGVGTALSAAFQATAVLFVIDALIQGVEKIKAWSEQGEKIAEAWHRYDQTIFESSEHMQKEIDKQEQKLIEMTQGPVAALEFALKHLQSTAFETFSLISKDVEAAMKAMKEQSGFTNVFGDSAKDLDKFRDQLESVMRHTSRANPDDPFAPYRAAIAEVQQKERDLTTLIAQRTAASGKDASAAVDGLHAERQAVNDMLPLLQQGIKLEEDRNKALKQNIADERASQASGEAKRTLDAKLAGIEQEKAAQHLLFAEGKIGANEWAAAQIKAANDAAAAQADYRARVLDIDQKSGQLLKARVAGEELVTEKTKEQNKIIEQAAVAIEKAKEAAKAFNDQWDTRTLESQAKATKLLETSLKELTVAERNLGEAQKNLSLAESSASFKQQEVAIKELSNLRVISKQREAALLTQLSTREEQDALRILREQLADEERQLNLAKTKFQAATKDALFPPEQLAVLKTNLDNAQVAWDKTQTQIIKQQSAANDRRLALDRTYYGQAVALAIAFGKQELAEKLQANHAALLSAQAQLADARARGLNTTAIQRQVNALQKLEKELIRDTAQQTKQHSLSLSQFSQLSKTLQAYEAELDRSGSKAAAWGASLGTVISGVAEAWAQGGISIEQALAKVAAAEISAIAQVAEKEGTKQLALAFGSYPDAAGMAHHFGSAALWFGLAGGLSAASGALSGGGGGGKSSASSGGSAGPAANSPNVNSQQPSQVVNVTHLAGGGLATRPTFAVIGDSASGGSAREAVLPLDNNSAMKQIAQAIAAQMKGSSTPVEIHFHGGIGELVSRINKGAQDGTIRVYATHSRNGTALSK